MPDSIDGRKMSQDECDRLHFLKNRPDPPQINGMPIEFPPYEYRPFPCAMYHADHEPELAKDDSQKKAMLAKGWTDNPADVAKAKDDYIANVVAVDAAVRAHDDRRMSEKARAEFTAADVANGEDHLLDLPVPVLNKRRGRPKKTEAAPAA